MHSGMGRLHSGGLDGPSMCLDVLAQLVGHRQHSQQGSGIKKTGSMGGTCWFVGVYTPRLG